MNFYSKELETIAKRNRFRKRRLFGSNLVDLASNDYLSISENPIPFEKTITTLREIGQFSPKASMLVNGYHEIHYNFERFLSEIHQFESAIVVGSGFLANFGLIEALVRNGDELFLDSEYHASGMVATRLLKKNQVHIFPHNSSEELEKLLRNSKAKRKIVAIEGIYSMSGDIANRDIFDVVDRYGAVLIVDEAHSFGVVGDNLLGIFDYFNIKPQPNHIKMGTLGKAVGSYGAYILASNEIVSFLENRAKPVIYSTALSLFDTLLAYFSISYILENRESFRKKIDERKELFSRYCNLQKEGLIYPIEIGDNRRVVEIRDRLEKEGFIVGAIRPPTVEKALLRVIPRVGVSLEDLEKFLSLLLRFRNS